MTRIALRSVFAAALAAALASVLPATAFAAGVQVARSIPYAAGAPVPPKVKEQCGLATRIPEAVAAHSSDVELVDKPDAKAGRALLMEITDVHAPGGGPFSGPKWVEVKGTLSERGKQIGSFRAKRFTMGGPFGLFIGTCGIVQRNTGVLGEDIARFLANPSLNAELGDAK